ncbi:7TMR-DISMED2 domain-containing protein [Arenimonas daejeonensis]|uniref:7TMR-DISMED2 domain-containing protein n=1 Tax=Arenimonas daejeonensis TaxID=370777 RepID=UPI0013153D5C|nr:hypothetical protein [Arenimonas daejeonensis]
MRIARAGLFAVGFLLTVLFPAPVPAADPGLKVDLAVMETPVGTRLEDILSGRAQPGFTPVLTPGFSFAARDGTAIWVRIRTELPPGDASRLRLVMPRVPLDRLRLRLPPSGEVVANDSFFRPTADDSPWSANFELPLPAGLAGKTELYLELEGRISGGLHLRLLDIDQSASHEARAQSLFRYTYLIFLLVAALSLARHAEDPQSGALSIGAAALASWLACLGINGHLYALPEIAQLTSLGATVPLALLLLGAGPLVLATRHYAGLSKSAPGLVPWMRGLGWLLVALAAYCLIFPSLQPHHLQWVAWIGYVLALAACLLMLLMDSRTYRWGPILALSAVAVAVVLRVLADHQAVEAGLFNLYGAQLLLAVTMALYLGLPWIRARLQRWAMRKRAAPPEPSAEEKIQLARERLLESLQSGLKNAADGDLKWIAFRRLLDGLKPVLSQSSAAVVAMHFHGEDMLQVEPPSAEPRYRELLEQRATLLKNLSRLRAAADRHRFRRPAGAAGPGAAGPDSAADPETGLGRAAGGARGRCHLHRCRTGPVRRVRRDGDHGRRRGGQFGQRAACCRHRCAHPGVASRAVAPAACPGDG